MSLQKRLSSIVKRHGKWKYDEILQFLEDEALNGEFSTQINEDCIHREDVHKLKQEGLNVCLVIGVDYNYYNISW